MIVISLSWFVLKSRYFDKILPIRELLSEPLNLSYRNESH